MVAESLSFKAHCCLFKFPNTVLFCWARRVQPAHQQPWSGDMKNKFKNVAYHDTHTYLSHPFMQSHTLLLTKRQLLLQAVPASFVRHRVCLPSNHPQQPAAGAQRQHSSCSSSAGMGKASTALSKRLHAFVGGRVQGVFFRSYTKVCRTQPGHTRY